LQIWCLDLAVWIGRLQVANPKVISHHKDDIWQLTAILGLY
jgi:hypothetical protein